VNYGAFFYFPPLECLHNGTAGRYLKKQDAILFFLGVFSSPQLLSIHRFINPVFFLEQQLSKLLLDLGERVPSADPAQLLFLLITQQSSLFELFLSFSSFCNPF